MADAVGACDVDAQEVAVAVDFARPQAHVFVGDEAVHDFLTGHRGALAWLSGRSCPLFAGELGNMLIEGSFCRPGQDGNIHPDQVGALEIGDGAFGQVAGKEVPQITVVLPERGIQFLQPRFPFRVRGDEAGHAEGIHIAHLVDIDDAVYRQSGGRRC